MNEAYNLLVNEKDKFLGFYKFRFPVFHKSNVFYRDLVYCVKYYLGSRNVTLKDKILEKTTQDFIKHLETSGILNYMSPKTWLVNYPEFSTVTPVPGVEAGVQN